MLAEVVLAKSSKFLDKSYHYSIPERLAPAILVGSQVVVPFGKRTETGFVIGLTDHSDIDKLKEIIEVASPSPLFDAASIRLARWISKYYFCFFISALKLFLPPGKKTSRTRPEEHQGERQNKNTAPEPNEEQKMAIDKINACIDEEKHETYLLYGVTGSGKTEVYIRAAAHALSRGKGSIILVPEIALTPQVIERFTARFDNIALLHSGLTPKRRRDEWDRVHRGEAKIVVGTRSALFAPVKDLGLLVLDEEYENTYKAENNPRYNAREVAIAIGKEKGVPVVLGSATPSVESYYLALNGQYGLLKMDSRIDDRPLPPVEILDLKEEKGWLLSHRLREEIKATLEKGEKVILFLNRRGYFTTAICKECGYLVKCPNCSVSMLYHSAERKLRCSHCGHESAASLVCPKCHHNAIGLLGTGTQRIENEVASTFKDARIIRMDTDSLSKSGSHKELFELFARGDANVLIGTQLVTKGLDIAMVTLIGVVNADSSLNLPDFRAAERTFQQLTQVAGRAGRHHLPGKVIVQTYNPGHYAIACAARHDYKGFYEHEIKFRQALSYPPFTGLILLTIMSEDRPKALKVADDLKKLIQRGSLLGPTPAPIEKIRGQYRFHILIKTAETEGTLKSIEEALEKVVVLNGVRVLVDVDPLNML